MKRSVEFTFGLDMSNVKVRKIRESTVNTLSKKSDSKCWRDIQILFFDRSLRKNCR
ncbi:MAG: hypothetical protein R3C26_00405 [Calditrichia bacterium]